MKKDYALVIHEDGWIESAARKDGMPERRWLRELLFCIRHGAFAEVHAPGGVLLYCPGAADSVPVNKAACAILRDREMVCGKAVYLPGKEGDGYRLYSRERAEREKKILEVLIR